MAEGYGKEEGYRKAGGAEPLARAQFVGGDRRSFRRVPRDAQRLRGARGDDRRTIADDDDAVDWTIGGGVEDRAHRRLFVVEANRDRAVLPWVLDQVAAIGREDEFHAELLGGVA